MKRTVIVATGNQEKMVEIRQILESMDVELITMKEAGADIEVEETGSTFEGNALLKARAVAAVSGQIAIADDSGLEVDAMPGELGIHSARWMGHDTSYDIKNREIIRRVDAYCAERETEAQVSAGAAEAQVSAGAAEAQVSAGAAEAQASAGAAEAQASGRAEEAQVPAEIAESHTPPRTAENPSTVTPESARHPGCGPDGTPGPLRSARFVSAVAAVWPDGRERTARGVLEGRIYTEQKGFNGFGYDPIFYLPEYGTTSGDIPREEKNRISHRGKAFRKLRDILEEEGL